MGGGVGEGGWKGVKGERGSYAAALVVRCTEKFVANFAKVHAVISHNRKVLTWSEAAYSVALSPQPIGASPSRWPHKMYRSRPVLFWTKLRRVPFRQIP